MLCVAALPSVFWRAPLCVGSRCLGLPRERGEGSPAPLVARLLGGLVHKTGLPWLLKSDPWGLGEGGEAGGKFVQEWRATARGPLGTWRT